MVSFHICLALGLGISFFVHFIKRFISTLQEQKSITQKGMNGKVCVLNRQGATLHRTEVLRWWAAHRDVHPRNLQESVQKILPWMASKHMKWSSTSPSRAMQITATKHHYTPTKNLIWKRECQCWWSCEATRTLPYMVSMGCKLYKAFSKVVVPTKAEHMPILWASRAMEPSSTHNRNVCAHKTQESQIFNYKKSSNLKKYLKITHGSTVHYKRPKIKLPHSPTITEHQIVVWSHYWILYGNENEWFTAKYKCMG